MVTGMETFKRHFAGTSPEWKAITQSLENSGIRMTASELLGILQTYFIVT